MLFLFSADPALEGITDVDKNLGKFRTKKQLNCRLKINAQFKKSCDPKQGFNYRTGKRTEVRHAWKINNSGQYNTTNSHFKIFFD